MSSRCTEFNDCLLDLAYEELDEVSTARLMEHKNSCASCSQAYDEIMGVRSVAKSIDTPAIPSHFDSAILSLAQETARNFKEDVREHSIHPPVNTPHTLSTLEKIQAFIFKPPVFGLGLAAAAVLIAVISMKDKPYTTMLESEDDAPFVGGTKAPEQEELAPSAPAAETMTADKTEATIRPQIQKAGPNYQPGMGAGKEDAAAEPAEPLKASRKSVALDDTLKKKMSPGQIQKNPADLLGKVDSRSGGSSDYSVLASANVSKKSKKATSVSATKASPTRAVQESMVPSASMDMAAAEEMEAAVDDSSNSYFEAGLAAYNRGDCSTAVKQFRLMIDTGGGPAGSAPTATHYIARCEKRTGRCSQALISYEKILKQYYGYSMRAEVLYEAAMCHKKLGHTARANQLLEELALDPDWKDQADAALESSDK